MRSMRPSSDFVALACAGVLLVVAMALGGQAHGGFDAVVQALALPSIGLAVWRWRFELLGRWQTLMFAVLASAMALAVLQLLPIPVGMYELLPGRQQIVTDLARAGMAPRFLPLSVDRWATVRTLLALATFTAMWMLCTTLAHGDRVRLAKLALVAALPLVILGFVQASVKRDTTGATAWFANRNHYASLMAMLVPLAFAAAREDRARHHRLASLAWLVIAGLLLLAAALSFSRAGFSLACLAAVAAVIAGGEIRHARRSVAPLLAVVLACGAIGYFASDRLAARFASDLLTDLRWQYLAQGWEVMGAWLPWGSGLGTFALVYGAAENAGSMAEFSRASYAHNDVLQVGIEAGWMGLLLLGLFVGILGGATADRIKRQGNSAWACAAAVSIAVVLLHSLFDYPLRTLACSLLMALSLSLFLPARRVAGPG